jgi:predicted ATP-grasp superfamily ATP-dependent carboligase
MAIVDNPAQPAPRPASAGSFAGTGVVVLGSDYRALGVVRSLGRQGVPVVVVRHGDDRLGALSRYSRRRFRLPHDPPEAQIGFLLDLAREHGLDGWGLLPTADETTALVARHHGALSSRFRVCVAPWDVVRWAHDKRLTHALAEATGVAYPITHYPKDRADVEALECEFPAVIKPAIKEDFNRLTAAKAWRVDTHEELVSRYVEACGLVDPALLTVQELIPGTGECQLSFAALAREGKVLAGVTARRTRQFPMDFGRASTFVETVEEPEVTWLSERLLEHIRFTGLIEVEFKQDVRDGRYKLLDMNPRPWGWHSVGARAGVDFPHLLWRMLNGERDISAQARPGVSWMRFSTDCPTALREIVGGRLSVRAYLTSFRGARESAIFARDDLVPGLFELPLLALLVGRRFARRDAV